MWARVECRWCEVIDEPGLHFVTILWSAGERERSWPWGYAGALWTGTWASVILYGAASCIQAACVGARRILAGIPNSREIAWDNLQIQHSIIWEEAVTNIPAHINESAPYGNAEDTREPPRTDMGIPPSTPIRSRRVVRAPRTYEPESGKWI